jgi:hypothetical protein
MHPGGHPYTLRCIDPVTGERDVLNTRADVLSYLKWHRPQGKHVMTAEDDPAVHAAEVVAPTMSTGSGLDMSVQPTEVEGRAATFQLTYRNHSPVPITVALTAQDGDEGLRFRCEPAEPMIVPAGGVSSVLVHVVPKVREMVGVPHAYAIVLRALPVWSVRESNADLVREVRFTYVPLIPTPAPTMLPAWLRRLPVWTLPLPLVLLFLLLVLAASWTRASSTTQPTRPQPRVTSRTLALSRPSIRRFTLVHPHQGQPYELVWQTSEAQHVTLDGRPVAAHGAMVLQDPLHSARYQLVATNGSRRATAHLQLVVDARTTDPHAFVLTTPDIAIFAVRRRHSRLHAIWLVRRAIRVQLQGRPVASSGERPVPPGASTLRLTAANDVGSRQRVLRVARAAPTATPRPRPTATPTVRPTGTPLPGPTATSTPPATGRPAARPAALSTPPPTSIPTLQPTVTSTLPPTRTPTPPPTATFIPRPTPTPVFVTLGTTSPAIAAPTSTPTAVLVTCCPAQP